MQQTTTTRAPLLKRTRLHFITPETSKESWLGVGMVELSELTNCLIIKAFQQKNNERKQKQ